MKTEWSTYSLLDTNVLVYALEPSDEFKHEIANELFESLFSGEEKLAVSTQIEICSLTDQLKKPRGM